MNSFLQNRSVAVFLGALISAVLLSLGFLIYERRAANEATARLQTMVNELNRLRRITPFPNGENLAKTRSQVASYRGSLLALEGELREGMLPVRPLQPNEFQAQLRLAVNAAQEAAAMAKVQLPVSFNLGFDEYARSLPDSEAAPLLGQQLHAIAWIVSKMIEAHIDSLGNLTRTPLPEEKQVGTKTSQTNAGGTLSSKRHSRKIADFSAIDISFSGSPAAARRVINQIAACKEQTYVVRTLRVRNQVDKGPKRSGSETVAPTPASDSPTPLSLSASPTTTATKEDGITFIVGTEHLDLAARVEIMSFSLERKIP